MMAALVVCAFFCANVKIEADAMSDGANQRLLLFHLTIAPMRGSPEAMAKAPYDWTT